MESFEHVVRLTRVGRFRDALRALSEVAPDTSNRSHDVLEAALLEHVGEAERASAIATKLLKSKYLTPPQRSSCEIVLGRLALDRGDVENAFAHLQRAALIAQQAADLHALFDAKLQLLVILSDRSGPAAASSLLADVRRVATKVGDPIVTVRLHLWIAQAEAKRGLLDNASKHSLLAKRILQSSPHAHLEAFCGNLD